VDLAKAQDVEVGDGTTTVTVLAGALLAGCQDLLAKGIHPTTIAEGYQRAAHAAIEILKGCSEKVRDWLIPPLFLSR
jgi:T-complex protein 1 subunit delta